MTLRTRAIASLPWDETLVATVELVYDDADLRARGIRVVNPAPRGLVIEAARGDRSRVYSRTFAAGETATLSIATNPPNRLQLSVDAQGRLDGVAWAVRWNET